MHHKKGATTMTVASTCTVNNNASMPNIRSSNKLNNQRRKTVPTSLLLFSVVLVATLTIHCIAGAHADLAANLLQNPCSNKQTCHECLRTYNCGWCLDDQLANNQQRCLQVLGNTRNDCRNLYNPQTQDEITLNMNLTKSRDSQGAAFGGGQISGQSSRHSGHQSSATEFSGGNYAAGAYGTSSAAKIVQIQPQRVNLKLRINEEYSLLMHYSHAKDYPIDLYYLMDLSKSMEDDKEKLSVLGDRLSETMRNITSDFRLGFGSFVDKVLMPYVSTIPKNIEQPCPNCAPPYGYHHIMRLSTDSKAFSDQVKKASVSGNLDAPEGGFDAIMQAIACRFEIGWREKARRLLVFSTDAGFHYAGDGKLGGVIAPNDGECHLDKFGKYTYSEIQDYPSISQINQKVKQNAINIIFAVTATQHTVYTKLSEHIEGSSSSVLSGDSSNVVELVKEQYNKISSGVEMKDNATSNVKITYYSACGKGPEIKTSKCSELRVGQRVTFTAKIMVTSCPVDRREWNQVIQIYPVGINESLIVNLQMLCSCDCENQGSRGFEYKSKTCNGNGNLMCGICDCDDSHFGSFCECSNAEVHVATSSHTCRADNETQVDCSGRGTCQCNVCECEKRANPEEIITGKFCECDNFSCERYKQELCAGHDHGTCECGRCVCKAGWTGSACDCQASNDTCMPPNGGPICSGHGECVCGVCKCETTAEGRYSGKHCDKCPTCAGRCQDLKDCVQCQMWKTGPLKEPDDCRANCTTFTPISVEKIEKADEKKEEQLCAFFDDDDCKFIFIYSEQGPEIRVEVQEKKECPPKVFMLGIVLGVIAAIVLIGLAILLLWKLLTTIHDRREFARFEKERMNAKWDTGENPIYKQATSTFKNPMYAGK